jgi:hypothetical protein
MGPKIISRKDAKGAKFGEIKARAAKKKMVGWSGAFASLASWRDSTFNVELGTRNRESRKGR